MQLFPHQLLNLLYPKRCPFCDRLLGRGEPYICRECAEELPLLVEKTCRKGGQEFPFEECFAPFLYRGAAKEAVIRFKYHDRPEYARFFAAAVFYYGKEKIREWKPDLIVPVPVHKSRLASRGYNQAALIAKELSALSGIPAEEGLIVRIKRTQAQKELGPAERKDNLKNAFSYAGKKRLPETVLIVDDIFTTGCTMGAVSEILKQNGTGRIFGACVCSGTDE